jgi:hypothetical protein
MTERDLMRQIMHAVGSTRRATLWRNNVGVGTVARGGKVAYGLGVGSADLVGFVHANGRFFALEIKTPKGRASHEQRLWIDFVNDHGGYATIVRSVDEALDALARAESGAKP